MPLDQLKIDRSFITELSGNENDVSIVEAIIALGRKLGLAVIAEGVESAQQLEFLHELAATLIRAIFFKAIERTRL
jgi:EAL domain-containing protein (putative c-di-GMP-specific phosphodiesterase class I)